MKKRELKRSIIRLIRSREMHGYEIQKILAVHGEKIQLSYLYKTLKEMCDEGLLESQLRKGEHGPQTRQYGLTDKGRAELGKIFGEATELIHDFYEEYISNLPPRFFTERFQRVTQEVFAGREAVALV
ncbi:MAG: PadR family transcriptional regulator, partial [Nitrososphaerales archaeon]